MYYISTVVKFRFCKIEIEVQWATYNLHSGSMVDSSRKLLITSSFGYYN